MAPQQHWLIQISVDVWEQPINKGSAGISGKVALRTESVGLSLRFSRDSAALRVMMGSQVYQVSLVNQDLQDLQRTVQGWAGKLRAYMHTCQIILLDG